MGRESRIRQLLSRRRAADDGQQVLANGQTVDGFLHQIQAGLQHASTSDDVAHLAGDVLRQLPPEMRLRDDASAEAATQAILAALPAEQQARFGDLMQYMAYRASAEGVIRFLEGLARGQR